jgi:dTDP-4-dehydrorhamnose reductase
MRVVVTGGAGQLARAIERFWSGHEVILPAEADLDLSRREAIDAVMDTLRPQVLINAGAYTAVDKAEAEAEQAMLINGTSVAWLAQACERHKALLVQISTDYVFDGQGTRPYREEDPTGPRSVYGRTKLVGEQEAAKAPDHLILRTAWLYDAWGKNFLHTMLNAARQGRALKVVDDQLGTPTTCRALARQLQVAVEGRWRGLFHGTCAGEGSWFDFAYEIFHQSRMNPDLRPCTSAEYPVPAPRPSYSVLDNSKRRTLGDDRMPDWREALAEVIAELTPIASP